MSTASLSRDPQNHEAARFEGRVLEALLDEIETAGDPRQTEAFLNAVGRRFASENPISSNPSRNRLTLEGLMRAMNERWSAFDAGTVSITSSTDGYAIDHVFADPNAGRLGRLMGPFLEGCYDGWMRSLGSGPALRTLRTAQTAAHVQFWHGR